MKKTSKKLLLIVVPLFIIPAITIMYRYYQERHFHCYMHHHIHQGVLNIDAIIQFYFNGNQGITTIEGRLNSDSDGSKTINKEMLFNFTNTDSVYIMVAKKSFTQSYDEVSDETLQKILPPFFFQEGRKAIYRFSRQNNGDYIITNGRTPIGYCQT
ncbi:hypothetical protein GIX45_07870 [Erwinia sp. CPCC 100877]|nr:hypothetical protein [Erwinia sp. CPCC 100877]